VFLKVCIILQTNLLNKEFLAQTIKNSVAYLLKAGTVEPGKQPLLANGSENTSVSRQRLGKHASATTDTHATIDVL
jgi:hypothetical protein